MTENQSAVFFLVLTIVLFLLRKTPLGFLWKWYKYFWLFFFASLTANYAKKEIKAWWNKD
jgi:energy-coupling factor transporter transmembrane protein EcfT